MDEQLGSFQCHSGSNPNVDDHFVVPGPTGHKARIRTLRVVDAIFATSSLYLTLVGKHVLPHTSLRRLGDIKSACCSDITKETP